MKQVTIAGKKYSVEIKNGVPYIDGKTVAAFLETLSFNEKLDCAIVGQLVLTDIVKGSKKKRSPQKMFNELHQSKNN